MHTELLDGEDEYGSWEYTIIGELEEARRLNPPKLKPDVWPHWRDGVPTYFRQTLSVNERKLGNITYFATEVSFVAELEWSRVRALADLKKNYSWLPTTNQTAWTGVYRIFVKGRPIGRLLGTDDTGTLYIGMAGQGPKRWSIMRNRLLSAAKRNHHVTMRWWYDHVLSEAIPWDSVMIEWAYTEPFVDYLGQKWPAAKRSENWLLRSYRDSYGEYPPLNEKG